MISSTEYSAINKIYESEHSVIYRGIRLTDQRPVILKVLNRDYPAPQEIARFKREYEITRSLDPIEQVICAYSIEPCKNSLMMVLEDIGGQSLNEMLLTRKFSLEEFLRLAIQMSTLVGAIHQQHIIHRDINPSNFVWNPETEQFKLIDFGIAVSFSYEHSARTLSRVEATPMLLEGTLAYISPEQSGRMNRNVDYRTDFYSLGVTLYEILLGFLPFQTSDSMELVHAHLAKVPRSPHEVNQHIPPPVSEIVMKLLSKTAAERYQSAAGLVADLEKCLEQLKHTGTIHYIAIGQEDRSRPFEISQKLYGRTRELHTLQTAFQRVKHGHGELLLVSGYSGIGKTALVHELQKPLIEQHGYFLIGKFEPVKSKVPYSAIIQALQRFILQLFTESEARLTIWKEKLNAALGKHRLVLTEFIPELEMLFGKTLANSKTSVTEPQHRLHQILQDMLQVLSSPEHPFVIFLDNLQWADTPSLSLIQELLSQRKTKALLMIGAYRPYEVPESHHIYHIIEALEKHQSKLTQILLTPLSLQDLSQLLTDTFHDDQENIAPFARLILEKTTGNPFAVREFLKTMDAEGLLTFDRRSRRWQWNLEQIQGLAMPENMVIFMTTKIRKLPHKIQHVLQFAACLGNRFDLLTLAAVMEQSENETVKDLEIAINEGIIFPADESYRYITFFPSSELKDFAPYVLYDFVHNRFQEAVLELIPDAERPNFHLKIGQYLLHQKNSAKLQEERFAEIVDHLNIGMTHFNSEEEQLEVVRLNLLAGRQAKNTGDYLAARQYLVTGSSLLVKDRWQTQYRLMYEYVKEQAEVEYLAGNFVQSEMLLLTLLEHARPLKDQIGVYQLLILHYTLQGRYTEAIQTGEKALNLPGIGLSSENMESTARRELTEIRRLFTLRPPASLLQVSSLIDASAQMTMKILQALILPALYSNFTMYTAIVARMMKISLTAGHTPESVSGYAHYGVLLGALYGEYHAGYELGQLAVTLSEKFDTPAQKSQALFTLAAELTCWVKHLKFTHTFEYDAYHTALDAGERHIAGLALMHRVINLFYEGANLEQIQQTLPQFRDFVQSSYNQVALDMMNGCQLILENLLENTPTPRSFDTELVTESQFLIRCRTHQNRIALSAYQIMKIQLLYLYGHPQEALFHSNVSEEDLEVIQSLILRAAYNFYESLCIAAIYPTTPVEKQPEYWERLRRNQQQMHKWAESCPENFQHCDLLIQAEMLRLSGQPFEAMQLYHQAIEAVGEQKFPHQKALIHEVAAKFYQAQGFTEFAELSIKEAYYNYTLWGAKRKITEILHAYPFLLEKLSANTRKKSTTRNSVSISDHEGLSVLDLDTAIKVSQAISENIVLADLLKKMMQLVIENAGAQQGWLIRKKNDEWVIDAEGSAQSEEVKVLQAIPLESLGSMKQSLLPTSIIQYVIRTTEAVVLQDAVREGQFTHDPYITHYQVKSVLCIPLMKHRKISGVLYLENNLTTGIFTPARLQVLNMLSAQMVISIENATLYKQLRESLNHQIDLSEKQIELTNAYSRFIPKEFLSLLGKKSIVDVQLGDQVEKEITVMFSDIRGFTPISEQMTPQENFNFINSYLSRMSPIIQKHKGFIDKYIGDAIMALFPTNADDAVQCSLAMLRDLKSYNKGRIRAQYAPIQIGIGLNTGSLMLGTVGDQHRMDGTVISDAVNLASRIENMTKTYGVSLLIGETTYFQLENPSDYSIRIIDQVQAKGKSEPVTVFEVFDADPPHIIESKLKTLVLFKQGFKLYHRTKFAAAQKLFIEVLDVNPDDQMKQIAEAKELFNEILHVNPQDRVAQIYYQRCEQIEQYGVAEEWAGVWSWINALKKGNDIIRK